MFSYTLETSSHGYINSERQTVPFSVLSLQQIGESLALTLLEYMELAEEDKRTKEQKRVARLIKGKKRKNVNISRKKRTVSDVIWTIQKEKNDEESDSGGSDTEQEETQEETRTRLELRTNISHALEAFDRILNSQSVAANKTCKKGINDKPAKSSLVQFFSKKHQMGLFARRQLLSSATHPTLKNGLVDSSLGQSRRDNTCIRAAQISITKCLSTRSTKKRSNNHSDVRMRKNTFLKQSWERRE